MGVKIAEILKQQQEQPTISLLIQNQLFSTQVLAEISTTSILSLDKNNNFKLINNLITLKKNFMPE